MDIFFPIDQFGCFKALMGFIFLSLLIWVFKNGPPEAVKIIFSTSLTSKPLKIDHIEKCSESTGTNSVLYFFSLFFIKFHEQIIVSLLAIAIFFFFLLFHMLALSHLSQLLLTLHNLIFYF